jgi:hypothetical protein
MTWFLSRGIEYLHRMKMTEQDRELRATDRVGGRLSRESISRNCPGQFSKTEAAKSCGRYAENCRSPNPFVVHGHLKRI